MNFFDVVDAVRAFWKRRPDQNDPTQWRFQAFAWKASFDAIRTTWLSPDDVRKLVAYVVLIENTDRAGEDWGPIYKAGIEREDFTPAMKDLLAEAAFGIAAKGVAG